MVTGVYVDNKVIILEPERVRWIICSTNEGLRISQTTLIATMVLIDSLSKLCNCVDSIANTLYLEAARLTLTTCLLKLTSLAPDIRFDTIIGMRIIDRRSLTKVSQGGTALGSTEQDSVGSGGCSQSELIQCDAFTAGRHDALSGILGEGDGADAHLGAFEHADIIGNLADDDGNLSLFLRHVLGKTVETHGGSIHLRHVQTFGDGGAKLRLRSAGKELV